MKSIIYTDIHAFVGELPAQLSLVCEGSASVLPPERFLWF